MKILLLDIENTPNLAWVWQAKTDYVNYKMLLKERELLCLSWKWYQDPFTYWYRKGDDDMLPAAHDAMSQADAIITFNGLKHDIPILTDEFLRNNLFLPPDTKQIDLIRPLRSKLKLFSNSLDFVLRHFGLPGKEDHDGFATWLGCMAEEKKAWNDMERYNRNDVVIMEPLYEKILPLISGFPNLNLFREDMVEGCPTCGGFNFQRRGYRRTATGVYARYQCQDDGRWFSEGKREFGAMLR